jgi:hypothetical protein
MFGKRRYYEQTAVPAPVRTPPQPAAAPREMTEAGRPLLSEMTTREIVAAAAVTAFVIAAMVFVLGVMVCYLLDLPIDAYVVVLALSFVVGLGVLAWRVIAWVDRAVERRNPRMVPYMEPEAPPQRIPPTPGYILKQAGHAILKTHFTGETEKIRQATREHCEKHVTFKVGQQAVKVTQGHWNKVNQVFVALGWKNGNSWIDTGITYEQAKTIFDDLTDFLDDDTAWVYRIDRNGGRVGGSRISLGSGK